MFTSCETHNIKCTLSAEIKMSRHKIFLRYDNDIYLPQHH